MSPETEGTIELWLKRTAPYNWYSDSKVYEFPTKKHGNIEVTSVKNSDRTLTVSINGLTPNTITMSAPVPHLHTQQGLSVTITWTQNQVSPITLSVTLFLNGKQVQQVAIPL